ncbi:hypothetical protein Bca52824_052688 [Brassica carinata]|uniref:Transmembrane protein n=1 Tax=Brassica carinata TaxID=52824 RepID=A0A8X7R2J1_BRACI|nr:hypothetical protein Bca52824_052688 [Brassica carinata]
MNLSDSLFHGEQDGDCVFAVVFSPVKSTTTTAATGGTPFSFPTYRRSLSLDKRKEVSVFSLPLCLAFSAFSASSFSRFFSLLPFSALLSAYFCIFASLCHSLSLKSC